MSESTVPTPVVLARPALLRRSIALMKPVTWFAPAWAFLCGSIASSGSAWSFEAVGRVALGMFLAGPILCGLSQVINDWCDREVDAINEPQRLIPSGRVSSRQVFITIGVLAVIALAIGLFFGEQVALLTAIGMVLAVLYSVPPVRAKRNGWFGNTLVGLSYEGLPWIAGSLAFCPTELAERRAGDDVFVRHDRHYGDQRFQEHGRRSQGWHSHAASDVWAIGRSLADHRNYGNGATLCGDAAGGLGKLDRRRADSGRAAGANSAPAYLSEGSSGKRDQVQRRLIGALRFGYVGRSNRSARISSEKAKGRRQKVKGQKAKGKRLKLLLVKTFKPAAAKE